MQSTMQRAGVKGIAIVFAWSVITFAAPAPARAQMGMSGSGRSLGGYGASSISSYYAGSSGAYIPYNGQASGFVPYRGGSLGGGGMGIPTIPRRLSQTTIGGAMMAATPIGGASLVAGRGMGMGMGGGRSMGSRPVGRAAVPFGYEGGIGMGSGLNGMTSGRPGAMNRSSRGPGFGSPFRMPPSLSGSTSSMAMP